MTKLPHYEHGSSDTMYRQLEEALRHLSAERALVLGVLADLHLLHHLTEGSTVAGSVLTANSCLLCALSHFSRVV